jgi:plasmid stabilization system protein ParE
MTPVELLPAARGDYDESFDWYAGRSPAAARHFSMAVDEALRLIGQSPQMFAVVDTVHRACLLKQFPYSIVYRVEPKRALVVAIAHVKRRPGYWRGRK